MNASAEGFTVFAHRGASGTEPENTLRAFRRAIEIGARWIELDVQCVGGRLVVFHDARLERTTNGTGPLNGQTIDALRSLDAGKGEKIPFLEEVLELVDKTSKINIELKGRGTAAPTASAIEEAVGKRGWTHDQFIVSSFFRKELKTAKALQSAIRIGFLYAGHPLLFPARAAEKMGVYSVHLHRKCATSPLVRAIHRKGIRVFVFTVNDVEDAERLRSMRVDGIFTDYPERFLDPEKRDSGVLRAFHNREENT